MIEPIFYEDHVRLNIPNKEECDALFHSFMTDDRFEEVIRGIDEICVKFDPAMYDEKIIRAILSKKRSAETKSPIIVNNYIFAINFDDALDMSYVVAAMNMSESLFKSWFITQNFYVEMMGFQPGFAYLGHKGAAPNIDRLSSPRSHVKAGSIGFRGSCACIYAHDGPGGWPIIGRIDQPIFDLQQNPPNILQNGDGIKFRC